MQTHCCLLAHKPQTCPCQLCDKAHLCQRLPIAGSAANKVRGGPTGRARGLLQGARQRGRQRRPATIQQSLHGRAAENAKKLGSAGPHSFHR